MLCLVMLSAGVAFAADNASDVVAADEIAIDEPLAVEQNAPALGESTKIYINNSNINQYIDNNTGAIYENVTADELIFDDTFENLILTVERPITLTGGNNSYFNNPNIEIYSSNVILQNFTILQQKGVNSIFVGAGENYTVDNVSISHVDITFTDNQNGAGAIPIEVINSNNFILADSSIYYTGRTDGNYLNNIIRITNSRNAKINDNKFSGDLASIPVDWVPSSSGWVKNPMSEGIVIKDSDNATFDNNIVDVTYNNVSGVYDTIYAVDVSGSDAVITNNNITANGNSYIYGIIASGDNFTIKSNNINSTGVYYANGMDIEGPASGVIENNNIDVSAESSAYAIYSGMNGANVTADYTGNNITGKAYNVFGFSLGDVSSNLNDNFVDLTGNYTTGVAFRGSNIKAIGNRIILNSSEEGNESIWEGFGVEAVGIKVIKGGAYLGNNTIATSGKGVSLTGNETASIMAYNFINVVAGADKDAYAIYAVDASVLLAIGNTVDYQGATNGAGINNAVYLNNVSAWIAGNKFDLDLVSSYVPWYEIPAGSGNWVSSPVSEGIVFDESDNVMFRYNEVNVTYNDVVGDYDTIYAVSFKNSDNATIKDNNITANGHSYVYGLQVSGNNFTIENNTIAVASDNNYANGIDIEGPASGVVKYNNIDVNADNSVYAIYSGMNGADVTANYTGNNITGKAYNVFGFSLGDVSSDLYDNFVDLTGNYTTGVAFRGGSINATGNRIILNSSEEGNESIQEKFGVEAVGIKVVKGAAYLTDNTIATAGKGVSLTGNETSAYLADNFINVVAGVDKDAYAIYAVDVPVLFVLGNTVDYQGATKGTGVNNAVYLNNVSALMVENKFDLDLVSSAVTWVEIPSGSGNWVSFPVSEGIVFEDSDNVIFMDNNVDVTYNDALGFYDTIYSVSFKNSNNALIKDNNITANGHNFIYGLQVSGENFTIEGNNISVSSDIYYANGIDIEGPASGVVKDNEIYVSGIVSAYAIYSGMNGANVSANYTGNDIAAKAYNVFGFSLGDVESNIVGNDLILFGNYTTGIAFKGSLLTVENNAINALGTNVGDEKISETFGVETIGIKVTAGNALIINNNINSTANYTIDVKDTNSSVHDNYLLAKELMGDYSVNKSGDAEVYDNNPKSISGTIEITEVDGDCTVIGVLKDAKGNPIKNETIDYSVNGVSSTVVTDENGTFRITNNTNGELKLAYVGDALINPVNASIILKDIAAPRLGSQFNVTEGVSIKTYAVDSKAGEVGQTTSFKLTDSNGNPIVNATVKFAYKTVILERTTDENGIVFIGINTQLAQEALCAMSYLGDDKYNATFVAFSFDIQKKPITISAPAKSYKASAKTKKYTVTIKTEKCNSRDGKVYLSAGKKITMKINGKTYTAKTNAKGQATFNLKITKKGKFAATVKFAGDKTYASASKSVKITIK